MSKSSDMVFLATAFDGSEYVVLSVHKTRKGAESYLEEHGFAMRNKHGPGQAHFDDNGVEARAIAWSLLD